MNPIEPKQFFVNLIRNAVESKPDRAIARIMTELANKDEIEDIIEDDGPGIPAEHLGQVFDPFDTARLSEGGTALGFSAAHA